MVTFSAGEHSVLVISVNIGKKYCRTKTKRQFKDIRIQWHVQQTADNKDLHNVNNLKKKQLFVNPKDKKTRQHIKY